MFDSFECLRTHHMSRNTCLLNVCVSYNRISSWAFNSSGQSRFWHIKLPVPACSGKLGEAKHNQLPKAKSCTENRKGTPSITDLFCLSLHWGKQCCYSWGTFQSLVMSIVVEYVGLVMSPNSQDSSMVMYNVLTGFAHRRCRQGERIKERDARDARARARARARAQR